MGLAESAPSTPTGEGSGGGRFTTLKRHFGRSRNHALMRSPSAPANVTLAESTDDQITADSKLEAKYIRTNEKVVSGNKTWRFLKSRRRSSADSTSIKTDCHYTCHPQCRELVTLDCNKGASTLPSSPSTSARIQEAGTIDESQEDDLETVEAVDAVLISTEDNQPFYSDELSIKPVVFDVTMEEDGATFRGFIRVHMNLCRPISVVAGTRPPSIYDILKEDSSLERTLTSFYLPRDTVKALHITSVTTASQVIAALLKKFKVVDNPRKFALYERYYEDGETAKVKMRRISDNETPLNLALNWSKQVNCNKMFVLQENDTGDILWENFSIPELSNFLRILDREEEEYKRQVRHKYQRMAHKIREAMQQLEQLGQTGDGQHATTSGASADVAQ